MGASPHPAPPVLAVAADLEGAIRAGKPIVALESAVITHGLPYPQNLETALRMEREVADAGASPATIAVLDGVIHVGVGEAEMRRLAESPGNLKIGVRDLPAASIRRACGGTTVAATMFAARHAGIIVFATGGIGGVHREIAYDISADLQALAHNRMVVVCAGAKAILDLAATLEVLENASVPVLGYGTDEFPAFYCTESGLPTSARADSPSAVAQYWERHCAIGLESAVLVVNPIPKQYAIAAAELGAWIDQASTESRARGVRGQQLTPFLLRRIGELSGGRTIMANTALLLNNAKLAGKIAAALAMPNHIEERIQT